MNPSRASVDRDDHLMSRLHILVEGMREAGSTWTHRVIDGSILSEKGA